MADSQRLREVARLLVDEYGWAALEDRDRIRDWLADRDLLSPADAVDERADRDAVDFVESHARWLLS
jgi:hypothetical protein